MTQTAKKIVNRINTPSLAKLFANKNTEVNDVVPTNEVNVPKIETTNLSVNNATQTNYSVPQNSQISKVNTLAKSFDNKFSRISGIQLKEETIPDNLQADTDGKYRRKSADGSIQFESDGMKIIEKPVLALSDYEEVFRDLVSSLHSNFNLSKKPLTIDEISELYNEYGAREKPAIEDLQRAVLNGLSRGEILDADTLAPYYPELSGGSDYLTKQQQDLDWTDDEVLLQFVDYEDEKEVNHIVAGKQLKSRADEIRNMYEVPFYLTDMQILQQIASDVPEIQEVMEVYENTQFTVEEKSALNNALNAMTREERAYSDAEGKILGRAGNSLKMIGDKIGEFQADYNAYYNKEREKGTTDFASDVGNAITNAFFSVFEGGITGIGNLLRGGTDIATGIQQGDETLTQEGSIEAITGGIRARWNILQAPAALIIGTASQTPGIEKPVNFIGEVGSKVAGFAINKLTQGSKLSQKSKEMLIEDATFAVLFLMFKGAKKLKDAGLESKPIKPYYEAVKQTINNTIKGYNMGGTLAQLKSLGYEVVDGKLVRNEKLAKEMEKTDSLDREIREENEQIAFTSEVLKSNIKNFKTTVKSFKEIIEDVERRARGVEAVEIVSDEFIQKAEKAANRANSPEEANIIKEEVEAYRNEIKNGQTATTPLTKKQVKNIAKETGLKEGTVMLLNKNPYTNKMLDTLDKIDAGDLTTKGSDITQDILDDVLTEYTQQVNNKIKKLEAIADATYNKLGEIPGTYDFSAVKNIPQILGEKHDFTLDENGKITNATLSDLGTAELNYLQTQIKKLLEISETSAKQIRNIRRALSKDTYNEEGKRNTQTADIGEEIRNEVNKVIDTKLKALREADDVYTTNINELKELIAGLGKKVNGEFIPNKGAISTLLKMSKEKLEILNNTVPGAKQVVDIAKVAPEVIKAIEKTKKGKSTTLASVLLKGFGRTTGGTTALFGFLLGGGRGAAIGGSLGTGIIKLFNILSDKAKVDGKPRLEKKIKQLLEKDEASKKTPPDFTNEEIAYLEKLIDKDIQRDPRLLTSPEHPTKKGETYRSNTFCA